jgi:hypothetical protein
MVVTDKCEVPTSYDEKGPLDFKTVERTIFDGDIDPTSSFGDCKVRSTAGGGIIIEIIQEDEFGFQSCCKISLEKEDLEVIDRLKAIGVL